MYILVADNDAHLDVAMYGFWGGRFQKAILDVMVFSPRVLLNRHGPLAPGALFNRHGPLAFVYR